MAEKKKFDPTPIKKFKKTSDENSTEKEKKKKQRLQFR